MRVFIAVAVLVLSCSQAATDDKKTVPTDLFGTWSDEVVTLIIQDDNWSLDTHSGTVLVEDEKAGDLRINGEKYADYYLDLPVLYIHIIHSDARHTLKK